MYTLTVTLHLTAMVAWMAAMIGVPAVLLAHGAHAPKAETLDRLRQAYRGLAVPGLALTWVFGLANLVQSGAWTEGWLHAKLVLVVALSGLHGALSARLKRLEVGGPIPGVVRAAPWITLLLVLGAVWLPQGKPF